MACLLHKGNRWRGFVSLNAWLMVVWTHNWELLVKQSAAAAASLQSCPTLCDPIDGSPPGSPIPGILQARTQEWVAISFPKAWKWKVQVKLLSLAQLLATPCTAAYQAPPSTGFSRQEYWSGLPLPSPHAWEQLNPCAITTECWVPRACAL